MKKIILSLILLLTFCLISAHGFAVESDGVCVEGNCENGFGTLVWSDNDGTYIGEFKNGWEHGHGTYTMPNGFSFEGEFINGKREGYGEGVYKDGRVLKGYWQNDKYIGEELNK